MRLEEQLSVLKDFGFALESGITVDDLLNSFDRRQFEAAPFDLIFFALGMEVEQEPWGRRFCRRIWNFDYECIEQDGDYARIARELAHVAGKPDALEPVTDHVDLDGGTAWLRYRIGEAVHHRDARIDDDWADPVLVDHVMRDLQSDDGRFYAKDNGQASILCYLSAEQAERLNRLSNGAWTMAAPDEVKPAPAATAQPKGTWLSAIRKWLQ